MGSEWYPLEIMRMLLVVGQLLLISSSSSSSQTISPNCQETCGDVALPYPFGIGDRCSLNKYFSIHCNATATSTPKPCLWDSNIEVLDISLDGELRIYTHISMDCYNESGVQQQLRTFAYGILYAFPFSDTKSKFTAIGCDTVAVIVGSNGQGFSSGCLSVCMGIDDVTGARDEIGGCQTTIPMMLLNYNASALSWSDHSDVWMLEDMLKILEIYRGIV